jgi:hypothetical protein
VSLITSCTLCHVQEWRIKAEEKALQTISRLRDQEECNTHLLRQLEVSVHGPVGACRILAV